MKRASLWILGILGLLATAPRADAGKHASARSWVLYNGPEVVAESVVDGVRRVNIGVPARDARAMIPVTLVCPDGTQLPEQEFPLYGGIVTVPVSVCAGGADATMAVLKGNRGGARCAGRAVFYHTEIPDRGQVRSSEMATGATVKRGCECGSWPSVPLGLALFGALPFALGFVTVSALRRRR